MLLNENWKSMLVFVNPHPYAKDENGFKKPFVIIIIKSYILNFNVKNFYFYKTNFF